MLCYSLCNATSKGRDRSFDGILTMQTSEVEFENSNWSIATSFEYTYDCRENGDISLRKDTERTFVGHVQLETGVSARLRRSS